MVGPPLALLRAINWRWVMNVVAPMITIRTADSTFVEIDEAPSRPSVCALELNDAPIGTPNTFASDACWVRCAVRIPSKCELKQLTAWTLVQPLFGCRLLSTRKRAKKTGI